MSPTDNRLECCPDSLLATVVGLHVVPSAVIALLVVRTIGAGRAGKVCAPEQRAQGGTAAQPPCRAPP